MAKIFLVISVRVILFTSGNHEGLPLRVACRGNPLWLPRRNRNSWKLMARYLCNRSLLPERNGFSLYKAPAVRKSVAREAVSRYLENMGCDNIRIVLNSDLRTGPVINNVRLKAFSPKVLFDRFEQLNVRSQKLIYN